MNGWAMNGREWKIPEQINMHMGIDYVIKAGISNQWKKMDYLIAGLGINFKHLKKLIPE